MSGEKTDELPEVVEAPTVHPHMRRIEMPTDKEFRVSSTANVNDLAWSIVKAFEEGNRPILVGIGVQAITQAVKAVAVANSRVASQARIFMMLPAFQNAKIPNPNDPAVLVERTLIKLILVPYKF